MKNPCTPLVFALAANGQAQSTPISGDFLICTKADAEFQMSFDGSNYFPWNQGLKMKGLRAKGINKMWLQSENGQLTNVLFYLGDVEIEDSRLNIIHDANQVLSVGAKIPNTYLVPGNANIAAGGTLTINGGNQGNERKDIIIFNLDPALNLQAQGANGITGAPIYAQDNLPLETSDTVKVNNPNGGPVAVCWFEVYYSPQ